MREKVNVFIFVILLLHQILNLVPTELVSVLMEKRRDLDISLVFRASSHVNVTRWRSNLEATIEIESRLI